MTGNGMPAGWVMATIGAVCEINPKTDPLPDETRVSFVPMAAVSDVTGEITSADIRPVADVKKGFTSFAENDVIFAKITPCMENGKSAVARGLTNGRGFGSTEFFVLRSRGAIEPDYLHRFVRQAIFRRDARSTMQSGVGQARVPKTFIEESSIPLPPLNEQRRVVAKLDELRARSHRARKALDEVPALLDKFKQSVLAAAFRGDLTTDWRATHPDAEPASVLLERIRAERRARWEQANPKKKYVEPEPVDTDRLPELPNGWCWAPFPLVVDFLEGPGLRKWQYRDCGIPFLNIRTLSDERIHRNVCQFLDPQEVEAKYSHFLVQAQDIIVSTSGTIGKTAVVQETDLPLMLNTSVMRFRPWFGDEPRRSFIHAFLRSPHFLGQALAQCTGTAQVNVGPSHMRTFSMPVPPLAEQDALGRLVERAIRGISGIARAMRQGISEMESLDQSVLAEAFRGELVPQDPTDEPAERLLARLGATETTAPPTTGRGRRRKAAS